MSNGAVCCDEMEYAVGTPEVPVEYVAKFNEFGLNVVDGGSSYLLLSYCPWCGRELARSLRDEWFEALESLGIDSIPTEFTDERWFTQSRKEHAN